MRTDLPSVAAERERERGAASSQVLRSRRMQERLLLGIRLSSSVRGLSIQEDETTRNLILSSHSATRPPCHFSTLQS